jgi:hypothetical protein
MNKFLIYTAGLFCLYSSVNATTDVPQIDFMAGRYLPDGTVLEGKDHYLRLIKETIDELRKLYNDNDFRKKFPHDYFGSVSYQAETIYDLYRCIGWRGMEEIEAMSLAVEMKRAFYYAQNFEFARLEGTWGPGDREGSLASLESAWEMIPAVIDYAQTLLDHESK